MPYPDPTPEITSKEEEFNFQQCICMQDIECSDIKVGSLEIRSMLQDNCINYLLSRLPSVLKKEDVDTQGFGFWVPNVGRMEFRNLEFNHSDDNKFEESVKNLATNILKKLYAKEFYQSR